MKYVVIKSDVGPDATILFPDWVKHSIFRNLNPVSAGFYDPVFNEVYGYSVSLDLGPREDDVKLIKLTLREGNNRNEYN